LSEFSVLFVGIALLFVFLAIASYRTKSQLEKKYVETVGLIRRTTARSIATGAKGWGSSDSFFYETVNWHFWCEFAGFLVAALAAILEYTWA
jgi:hypothetical protein